MRRPAEGCRIFKPSGSLGFRTETTSGERIAFTLWTRSGAGQIIIRGVVIVFQETNPPYTPASQPTDPTLADLLLACHERIRHFTAVARRIAEARGAPLDQIADAAADVHRYFTVAFPLHEADEILSIAPRLTALSGTTALAGEEALAQNREINILLRQLVPLWDALCREPEELPAFSPRLLDLSSQLENLCDAHLRLEEETVFPAINQLSAPDQREILKEMSERQQGNRQDAA